ncbi:MAG: hypothetical protein ACK54F_07995 [Planctomycetia bacterium]
MHGGPVSHIDTGGQTACDRHPANFGGLCLLALTDRPADLGAQATLDERPQRLPQFGRSLFGRDEQIVREINGRLHMGKHIPVFMAGQWNRPAGSSVRENGDEILPEIALGAENEDFHGERFGCRHHRG